MTHRPLNAQFTKRHAMARIQKFVCLILLSILALLIFPKHAQAIESPSSDGPVSMLDEPVFRIPMLKNKPKVDGLLGEKEWGDASAISAFWSNNVKVMMRPRWEHVAPHQIQSQVFAGYDKDHLYILYKIKRYPEASWLKANGRFPDVYNHPLYGLKQDDHIEFELRPFEQLTEGYKRGFFKWFANPIGVISDQYFSPRHGEGKRWQCGAEIKSATTKDDKWWFVEMKIPFANLKYKDYAGKHFNNEEVLPLPPRDGTVYRCWFKNGIGGLSAYVVLFDQHAWRVSKTKLILDSKTVAFQINDLGPIMEDLVDVKLTLKNHNSQSETVRLGFFMENAEGLIYSSYESSQTEEGLVELRPGESKQFHFKKKFPGISGDGNWLWFDVRTAGRPSKILFQNRLAKFHSTEPPPPYHVWRDRKLDVITRMRPKKQDFDFRYQFSPYTHKLSAVIDKGIYGASDDAKRAVEAHLRVFTANEDEEEVAMSKAVFAGDFATMLMQLPKDLPIGNYKVSLILFDKDQLIVGERNPKAFYKGKFDWEHNTLGKEDLVWDPFKAIEVNDKALDMLKIKYDLDESGLPKQIHIKASKEELPLEDRARISGLSQAELMNIGRGEQLRSPFRFEAIIGGQRLVSKVVEPVKLIRKWKSEVQFESKLKVGPIDITLSPQYDCDGSMRIKFTYSSEKPIVVDLLELVAEFKGPFDSRVAGLFFMQPKSGMDMRLSEEEGVVWDSAKPEDMEDIELYYSRFVPYIFFGTGDRGFNWICDSDENWLIDKNSSTMTLERNKEKQLTWRVKFVNHRSKLMERKDIAFDFIINPCKPREKGHRALKWLYWRPENYSGENLDCMPNARPWGIAGTDETFEFFRKRYPNGAPRLYYAPWVSSGEPELQKGAYTGEWLWNSSAKLDNSPNDQKGAYKQPWVLPGKGKAWLKYGSPSWADYTVYHKERQIRLGRVTGWWWDEFALPAKSECVANGGAYFRDPTVMSEKELPWQSNFFTMEVRTMFKRMARTFKKNNVPNYTSLWATNHPSILESFAGASELVESAAGYHLSHEVDNVTRYPNIYFRYAANTSNGLNTRIRMHASHYDMPGDELRLDRQVIGRALLHDIGVANELVNYEQVARIKNVLLDFGYYDDENTEYLPYWRNRHMVRYGEAEESEGFQVMSRDPHQQVYVSVYRKKFLSHGGVTGYKAMFVIMNESDVPVRGRLHILDSKRIFGGKNTVTSSYVYKDLPAPPMTSQFYKAGRRNALLDLETGGVVTKAVKGARKFEVKTEAFGPVYIPPHNYRVLYGHYKPGVRVDKVHSRRDERYPKVRHEALKKNPWWEELNAGIKKFKEEKQK